ncbi:MAG: acetyl-CoA acetyltransferase [Pseudomonadota bacterium]
MDEERIPVIVGAAQLVDRDADPERHIEPLSMLTRVATDAARDAGGGARMLEMIDTVALVATAGWNPANAPGLLAGKLGASPVQEITTSTGGQVGVSLLNHVASDIVAGRSSLAFVGGCNNLKVLMKAIAIGKQLTWSRGGTGSPVRLGGDKPGSSELEGRYGLKQPPDIYPLFENALRARLGRDLATHQQQMGKLFAGFTRVAASNPYAWFPVERSAEELITVTENNRMIAWPYPKYLNAILNTEQAAGLMVCSVAKARSLGIPAERWVYWHGGAHSEERAWWASERPDFSRCPSMQDTQVSALANARISLADINLFDFYSCFPIAVEMAALGLGLSFDDPRGFTVTGGLPYAGGPASAYTLHSLATMVEKLRQQPGSSGLVTGNGWYLTKHSAAVLASRPVERLPVNGLVADLPSANEETAPRVVSETASGEAIIETYTVKYNRDGSPGLGIVVGRTDAGERFLANTPSDRTFLESFVAEERVGCRGRVSTAGDLLQFEPD